MTELNTDYELSYDIISCNVNDHIKYVKFDNNKNSTLYVGKITKIIDDTHCTVNVLNTNIYETIESKYILLKLIKNPIEYYKPITMYDLFLIELISVIITFVYLYNFPFLLNIPIINTLSLLNITFSAVNSSNALIEL